MLYRGRLRQSKYYHRRAIDSHPSNLGLELVVQCQLTIDIVKFLDALESGRRRRNMIWQPRCATRKEILPYEVLGDSHAQERAH